MDRVHLMISGLVQGVFYRRSAQAKATELGLTGWIRNLPDGRVELQAAGERSKLQALVNWCSDGPRDAHVSGIDQRWDTGPGFPGFQIR